MPGLKTVIALSLFATTLGLGACTVKTTSPSDAGSTNNANTDAGANATSFGSFGMDCVQGAHRDFPIAVTKGEVIVFQGTWVTTGGDSVPGVVILDPAGQEIPVSGNPLGFSPGLVSTTPVIGKVVHEFFTPSGNYTVRFVNDPGGCAPVNVTAGYTRAAAPMTNTTKATATALVKGQKSNGHMGCFAERYFKISAAANEAISVTVEGKRFPGEADAGTLVVNLALLNAAGEPIVVSGNEVVGGGEVPSADPPKLEATIETAGDYFIKMTDGGCSVVIDYQIKY